MRKVPRSLLFTPATKTDHYGAAESVGAQALILDLEDSVAAADKEQARRSAIDYLNTPSQSSVMRALRVNAPTTLHGLDDLVAFTHARGADADFLVIPKAESAAVMTMIRHLLDEAGKTAGLIALAESASVAADPRSLLRSGVLDAVLFGAADMAASINGSALSSAVMGTARSQLLLHACAAGIPVLDTPYFDTKDTAGLQRAVDTAVAEGFAGKAAIHPSQISSINQGFTPTPDEIDWAKQVLAVNQKGVGSVNGQMVDEAVARRARRILDNAETERD